MVKEELPSNYEKDKNTSKNEYESDMMSNESGNEFIGERYYYCPYQGNPNLDNSQVNDLYINRYQKYEYPQNYFEYDFGYQNVQQPYYDNWFGPVQYDEYFPNKESGYQEAGTEKKKKVRRKLKDVHCMSNLYVKKTGEVKPAYKCTFFDCDMQYISKSGLIYHLNTVHNPCSGVVEKPFKCIVIGCKKRFKNKNGLKYHLSSFHDIVKEN